MIDLPSTSVLSSFELRSQFMRKNSCFQVVLKSLTRNKNLHSKQRKKNSYPVKRNRTKKLALLNHLENISVRNRASNSWILSRMVALQNRKREIINITRNLNRIN